MKISIVLCIVLVISFHANCDALKLKKLRKLIKEKEISFIPLIKKNFAKFSAKCAAINFPRKQLLQSMLKPSKLKMNLYTSHGFLNYTMDHALANLTDNNSEFDPTAKTMIYLHGYYGAAVSDDVTTIGRKIKKKKGYNMLSMDNSKYFKIIDYTLSAGFAPFIGDLLADFIYGLTQKGLPIKKMYLVGHGLGAQLAGFAAKKCQSKYNMTVGRITALDPAVPCALKPEKYVHKGDAKYVDVIHTSPLSFRGNLTGHADFYVNNWIGKQPGCYNDVRCAHRRALTLYAESTENPFAFFAKKCKSVILDKKCKIFLISLMGFSSWPITKGEYILKTKKTSPFGKGIFGLLTI